MEEKKSINQINLEILNDNEIERLTAILNQRGFFFRTPTSRDFFFQTETNLSLF